MMTIVPSFPPLAAMSPDARLQGRAAAPRGRETAADRGAMCGTDAVRKGWALNTPGPKGSGPQPPPRWGPCVCGHTSFHHLPPVLPPDLLRGTSGFLVFMLFCRTAPNLGHACGLPHTVSTSTHTHAHRHTHTRVSPAQCRRHMSHDQRNLPTPSAHRRVKTHQLPSDPRDARHENTLVPPRPRGRVTLSEELPLLRLFAWPRPVRVLGGPA